MSENARIEAEQLMPDTGGPYDHLRAPWRNGFERGAEWALAEVRTGLEALPGSDARGYYASECVSGYQEAERDALAVVDRLEGKP